MSDLKPGEIALPDVAARLHLSYGLAYARMLSGDLGPSRRAGRRWCVTETGVSAYLERTKLATPVLLAASHA